VEVLAEVAEQLGGVGQGVEVEAGVAGGQPPAEPRVEGRHAAQHAVFEHQVLGGPGRARIGRPGGA